MLLLTGLLQLSMYAHVPVQPSPGSAVLMPMSCHLQLAQECIQDKETCAPETCAHAKTVQSAAADRVGLSAGAAHAERHQPPQADGQGLQRGGGCCQAQRSQPAHQCRGELPLEPLPFLNVFWVVPHGEYYQCHSTAHGAARLPVLDVQADAREDKGERGRGGVAVTW